MGRLSRGAVLSVWRRTDLGRQVRALLNQFDPVADTATRTRPLHLTLLVDVPFRLGSLARAQRGTAKQPGPDAFANHDFLARRHSPCLARPARYKWCPGRARAHHLAREFQQMVLIGEGLRPGDGVVVRSVLGLIGLVAVPVPFRVPMGIVALLGVRALNGILIRNSIILVHEIHELLHKGRSQQDAAFEASDNRARPILLRAAAASLALSDLAAGLPGGRRPVR